MTIAIILIIAGLGGAALILIWSICMAASRADRTFEEWQRVHREHQRLLHELTNWHKEP